MRPILLATALISVVLPLLARAPGVHACSCAAFPEDEAGIRAVLEGDDWRHAIIAIGTAETSSQRNGSGTATVSVERVYRGAIGERVELRAEGLGGSCDYLPAEGSREFLVLTKRENGSYSASLCGSRTLDPALDPGAATFEQTLNAVAPGNPPGGTVDLPGTGASDTDAPTSGGASALWIIAATLVAVVAAGGIVLAVKRRRAVTASSPRGAT
jgi:hypothetical protein